MSDAYSKLLVWVQVRGAYMVSERALAASQGLPSPIHESAADTHACYDASLAITLNNVSLSYMSAACCFTWCEADVGLYIVGVQECAFSHQDAYACIKEDSQEGCCSLLGSVRIFMSRWD